MIETRKKTPAALVSGTLVPGKKASKTKSSAPARVRIASSGISGHERPLVAQADTFMDDIRLRRGAAIACVEVIDAEITSIRNRADAEIMACGHDRAELHRIIAMADAAIVVFDEGKE